MGDSTVKFKIRTDEGALLQFNQTSLGDVSVGFWATEYYLFTIPNGQDGSTVPPVDFGANFKIIGIECEDCTGIQAATNMRAQIAFDYNSFLCNMYEQDDPGTRWNQGALPQTGTLAFVTTHAFGVRKMRLTLTNPTTADVTFKIFGFHGGS